MQGLKIAALVPMRHQSVRVPEKNFRLIAGKPLYFYILHTLSQISLLEKIAVNTDSPVIAEGIKREFGQIEVIYRPEDLLGEDVPMNKILLHDISKVHADYYLQTHSTNPLIRARTLQTAIEVFTANLPEHDALFGVTRRHVRIWNEQGKPINHDPSQLIKTQDLPPFFEENSCLYIFTRKAILDTQNRLGKNPKMFEIPPLEAFDIDTETDFRLAQLMIEAGEASRD
jgi:CMP-N-acetylneuraminic acid synthetase